MTGLENGVKQRVRQFYDRVGWQMAEGGVYQNARYEDLRPVSRWYIRQCHLRVGRFLKPAGKLLLDAGSGPVQYVEYLSYSEHYQHRVCVDISIVALQEARQRLGDHGLFVVADVANLPFSAEPFDGVVSLHTLHHLPVQEQPNAYRELYRVLKPGSSAVVVNGWTDSALMRRLGWLVRGMEQVGHIRNRLRGHAAPRPAPAQTPASAPVGTFVRKLDAGWLSEALGGQIPYRIYCWRSVSVRFLRAVIHDLTGGRLWLRLLFALENRFPRWFGEKGQYPLIVIHKPGRGA